MSDPFAWLQDEMSAWESLGLRRELAERGSRQGVTIELDGRQVINFGSNDYLDLAGRDLSEAVVSSIRDRGWGSGASPLVSGRGVMQAELERRLAEFEGTESALLFPSGYAANCGVITALAGKGDVILSDAKNHASIVDGCRLSGARIVVYPHGDMQYVEMMLRQAGTFRRRLVVTDGLFSMDGDFAPLVKLAQLTDQYDAMLIVDEAHATGVFGELGRGVAEHLGVEDRIPVRVGTLSKAIGSIGGFVAGPRTVVQWLSNRARSYVFTTALPDAVAAGAIRALEIVRDDAERRRVLQEKAGLLRRQLRQSGWNIASSESQIVPLIIGAADETMRLSRALREDGLFVPGIRPPSVPDGESLLRISVTYGHTDEMLARLVESLDRSIRRAGG